MAARRPSPVASRRSYWPRRLHRVRCVRDQVRTETLHRPRSWYVAPEPLLIVIFRLSVSSHRRARSGSLAHRGGAGARTSPAAARGHPGLLRSSPRPPDAPRHPTGCLNMVVPMWKEEDDVALAQLHAVRGRRLGAACPGCRSSPTSRWSRSRARRSRRRDGPHPGAGRMIHGKTTVRAGFGADGPRPRPDPDLGLELPSGSRWWTTRTGSPPGATQNLGENGRNVCQSRVQLSFSLGMTAAPPPSPCSPLLSTDTPACVPPRPLLADAPRT